MYTSTWICIYQSTLVKRECPLHFVTQETLFRNLTKIRGACMKTESSHLQAKGGTLDGFNKICVKENRENGWIFEGLDGSKTQTATNKLSFCIHSWIIHCIQFFLQFLELCKIRKRSQTNSLNLSFEINK